LVCETKLELIKLGTIGRDSRQTFGLGIQLKDGKESTGFSISTLDFLNKMANYQKIITYPFIFLIRFLSGQFLRLHQQPAGLNLLVHPLY
jgi:hypothetical protein